jgi:hypothetical protein
MTSRAVQSKGSHGKCRAVLRPAVITPGALKFDLLLLNSAGERSGLHVMHLLIISKSSLAGRHRTVTVLKHVYAVVPACFRLKLTADCCCRRQVNSINASSHSGTCTAGAYWADRKSYLYQQLAGGSDMQDLCAFTRGE